jgi:hypothetical protein
VRSRFNFQHPKKKEEKKREEKRKRKPGVVIHTYNSITHEAETGGFGVLGHPGLYDETLSQYLPHPKKEKNSCS